jgi:hypothetical protein
LGRHAPRVNRPASSGLAAPIRDAYPGKMTEAATSPVDRIERALARIEAAAHERFSAEQAMALRHETLRTRMADAIAALDALIEREPR